MTAPSEVQFPPYCPKCKRLLADTAEPHCKPPVRSTPCGWLRCRCGVVIDSAGRYHPRDAA